MKVTIKKSKVSAALLKQLEAAGIAVTLIISSAAGAADLDHKPQDVRGAAVEAQLDQAHAETLMKLELAKPETAATVVADQE